MFLDPSSRFCPCPYKYKIPFVISFPEGPFLWHLSKSKPPSFERQKRPLKCAQPYTQHQFPPGQPAQQAPSASQIFQQSDLFLKEKSPLVKDKQLHSCRVKADGS